MFPFERILDENKFRGMDIVVCGHSLGGAIASIVVIKFFIDLKRLFQERSVKCITFGAPLIGDRDVQKYVAGQMSPCIHHFVCINDPVPKLLRYTQSVSPRLQDINTRLSAMRHNMQGLEDISSVASTFSKLLAMKDSYSSVIETIDKVMPMIGAAVNVASLVYPGLSAVKEFQKVFSLIGDVTTATKDNRNVYIPIGNFHFLAENFNDNHFFTCNRLKELEEYMQVKYQQNDKEVSPEAHALSHYTDLFDKNGNLPFGDYPYQIQVPTDDPHDPVMVYNRKIGFKYPYKPLINSVEVTKANGERSFLKSSFTGKNLFDMVLDLCRFDFNFPFAKNKENVKIKKLSMSENIERLVI